LRVSDRGYILRRGRVVLEAPSEELGERIVEIEDAYFAAG
jgi:ABC-type branched-subunit amino acid transport system ATPase component